ncbi:MAG TPA: hypothetical protein VK723_01395 [Thermoplasmata archaeon]|nr:hypothetical protein [Thermoplasmata archaeon]
MSIEEWVRIIGGALLLVGWVAIIAFGILLYWDVRKVPKEVLGARIFLNLNKFLRGFLLLSFGFLAVLLSAVPARLEVVGPYISLAGATLWLGLTGFALFQIFTALHVPSAIRKKFGTPAGATNR